MEEASVEIETIQNVERVLENIFDFDENDKNDKSKSNSEKKAPILFVNNELFPQSSPKVQQALSFDQTYPQLESLHQKTYIDWNDYYSLKGKFYTFVTMQNGSRLLQKVLLNTDKKIIDEIYLELEPKIPSIMTDSYANYFCQRFFSILSLDKKNRFISIIAENIEYISTSKIGTYSLQSLIEQITLEEEQLIILNSLKGKVFFLCIDEKGVHVIEKIICCFNEKNLDDIFNTIIGNFMRLATCSVGLFVCKKIISQAKHEKNLLRIREVLKNNSMDLILNQFGNYTIQIAVEVWPKSFVQPVIKSFSKNFVPLSCQKYSSNVIEKCLEKSDDGIISDFVDDLVKNDTIVTLLTNSFGNFVLQTTLKVSKGKIKAKLVTSIKSSFDSIQDKKLIKKWKSIISSSSHLGLSGNINIRSNKRLGSLGSSNSLGSTNSMNSYHSVGDNQFNTYNRLNLSGFCFSKSGGNSPMVSPVNRNFAEFHSLGGYNNTPFINQQNFGFNYFKPKITHSTEFLNHFVNNQNVFN